MDDIREQLPEILKDHALWTTDRTKGQRADLRGVDLRGAYLRGVDLQEANLQEANLREANLREANLREAYLQNTDLQWTDLQGADLQGAYLREANLRGADLQGAYLRGVYLQEADLREANLRGADLQGTILQSLPTPWRWVENNGLSMRCINSRTLVCGKRTRKSIHVGSTEYLPGHVYQAPYFSTCTITACHPGLYIAGNEEITDPIWVAYWLDESVIAGTTEEHKCRVRRFRVLQNEAEFKTITAEMMEVTV